MSLLGRNTQGVRVIRTRDGEALVSVSRIAEDDVVAEPAESVVADDPVVADPVVEDSVDSGSDETQE